MNRNTMLLAYGGDTVAKRKSVTTGTNTSGSSAVTPTGSASETHHTAIRIATATTALASPARPGPANSRNNAAAIGPARRPKRCSIFCDGEETDTIGNPGD